MLFIKIIKLYLIIYNYLLIKIKKQNKKDLNIFNLRINHSENPLGINIEDNNFSFLAREDGPFKALLFLDNKIIERKIVKLENCHSFYFKKPLEYNKNYKLIIKGTSTGILEFETVLKLESNFIKPKNKELFSPIFVKNFTTNKIIKKGRLYITGLGLYHAYINNLKVGNAYLTPGYNDYDYYLRYQTYNITKLLKEENIIEVHMGDGWYKGRFGINKDKKNNIFGNEYKLCLHILIEYMDKTILNIITDETWAVKQSKEVTNSIYDGEEVDYTLPEQTLEEVIITKEKYNLKPDFGYLIVQKDILYPELYISPKNEQILDFKQNMVGFIRFKGFLNKNQEIKMSHGEVLQNSSFFNDNLRTAKQILKYKGDGEERIYEPKFTYFGFRYVLIEGLDKVVIYTNLEKTIECKTDNDKINKLIENSLWSQKGNFLDVPTDCPQRDERLGWTADTQIFLNTACYNMDSYIFYKKYIIDLRGDQINYYNGDIPDFSPSLKHQACSAGAVWSDAGTIIPWNLYLNYGDKQLLKYSYSMMKDYVKALIKKDVSKSYKKLVLEGDTFGDWLALDGVNNQSNFGGTDHGFIKKVYYYHSIDLISQAAKELGYNNDFNYYSKLKNKIYNAILSEYFTEEDHLILKTQTSFVLCLYYKIYKNKEIIIEDFKKQLKKDLYSLKTGFIGTPLILLTLFDNNMDDIAYRILYNEDFPGWLYAINLGATTIWERWNSLLENGIINNPIMNSFNHYAYGSVCETIYSRIAGLRNIYPGWRKVIIKPQVNYRMKNIEFNYNSIRGKYRIYWRWVNKKFNMNITIPYGCEADIFLPNGLRYSKKDGNYTFECELNKDIYSPFSVESPLIDILKYN